MRVVVNVPTFVRQSIFARLAARKQMSPAAQVFLWAQVACLLTATACAVLALLLYSTSSGLFVGFLALMSGTFLLRFGEELYRGRSWYVMVSSLLSGAFVLGLAFMLLSGRP